MLAGLHTLQRFMESVSLTFSDLGGTVCIRWLVCITSTLKKVSLDGGTEEHIMTVSQGHHQTGSQIEFSQYQGGIVILSWKLGKP